MPHLNGSAARKSSPKAPTSKRTRVPSAASVDPLARVLETGPRLPISVTVALTILLHVGMAGAATAAALFNEIFAWQQEVRKIVDFRLSQYEMDIVKEAPPPPPPEPVKEPEPEPEKPVAKEPPPPSETPPPAPAEAQKVLTADPDPNAPVDLTGNTIVSGNSDTSPGGLTATNGTSKKPVYNPAAAATGVPGGTGTGTAPPARKEDRSRMPGLLGSVDWNDCPFPGEADAEQIDQAFVMIQVKVKPDGSPENVTVVQDPGHGFGREARKCAMRKKYSQGLDPDGNAIGGTTKPFRVRFER